MGFVGGGGHIAIATAIPKSSFVNCIVNIKRFMDFLYLIFYACLRHRFLHVETNHGPRGPVPAVCRILCRIARGLAGNLTVTRPWLRLSMIFCCALRLWSQMLFDFGPVLLCRGKMPWARGMAVYIRDGYGAFCQLKFECGCCEMLFF